MAFNSDLDAAQCTSRSFELLSECMKVIDGFLIDAVGRQIAVGYPNNTTETYTYYDTGSVQLYVLTVVYTDSTKANLSTVTRTA